jgi:hypothetical protein
MLILENCTITHFNKIKKFGERGGGMVFNATFKNISAL